MAAPLVMIILLTICKTVIGTGEPTVMISGATGEVTVKTSGSKYEWAPFNATETKSIVFKVKGSDASAAHVGLFNNANMLSFAGKLLYEIGIGVMGNSLTSIQKSGSLPFLVTKDTRLVNSSTPGIMSTEFHEFWVSWENNVIAMGHGCRVGDNLIASLNDSATQLPVNYVGFTSSKPHDNNIFNHTWTFNCGEVTFETSDYSNHTVIQYNVKETKSIIFKVKGSKAGPGADDGALVGLFSNTGTPFSGEHSYLIGMGYHSNDKTIIGKYDALGHPQYVTEDTPGIMSTEFRTFWVSWEDDIIAIGYGSNVGDNLIASLNDRVAPITVYNMRFLSDHGNSHTWKINNSIWHNDLTTFGYAYKVIVEDASDLTSYIFTVRAGTDAHVALNDESAPLFEIPIGAYSNSLSAIRTAKLGSNLVEHYEALLDSNRFRQFWVSWMDGVVKVGKGSTVGVDEFMNYTHGAPFTVNKISVSCYGRQTAYWRIPAFDRCEKDATEEHVELYLDVLNMTETVKPGNKTSLETKKISEKLRNTLQQDVATNKLTRRNLNTSLEALFSLSRIDFDPVGVDPYVALDTLINVASSADHLLSLNNTDSWQELLQKDETGAVKLASAADNIGRGIARMLLPGSTKNISLDNFAIRAISLPKNLTTAVYFNEGEHEGLPLWNVDYSSTESSTPMDSIEVKPETLKAFAKNTGTENLVMWATYHMTLDKLMPSANMTINSRIRALTVEDLEFGFTFHPPVTLHLRPLNSTLSGEKHCSFWNYTSASSGYWSQEGCSLNTTNDNQTTCECNHLTNFAILISPHVAEKVHARILGHISLIGCILSVLGCFATIVSYGLAWKEVKSQHAIVYLNLCAVLIVANVLFLTGIERVQNELACTVVAALLHYFWLVAFMLMLADGVMLILNVVYVFHVKRLRETVLLLFIAWFVPAVIVGFTLGVTGTKGYGTKKFCWLERSNGLQLTFTAPVAAIIVANLAVLIKVLHVAATSKSNKLKERNQGRAVIWNIVVILPLLGVAWIFGLLSVNEGTIIFQYVFAIANSLQGFFIFIFHCALNNKVRQGISSRMSNPSNNDSSQATKREMLYLKHSKDNKSTTFQSGKDR